MKKVLYIDMDGVLNLFEHDPDARTNMWKDGYFHDISPRENIESDLIMLSGYFDEIVILTKCIARDGVKAEKREFVGMYLSHVDRLSMVFVPYGRSKADYIDPGCFTVLLDDGLKNIMECEGKCDVAVLFQENRDYEYKNMVHEVGGVIRFLPQWMMHPETA